MVFKLDSLTRHAVQHTWHCLLGCGVGEIVGMLIAASLGWHRLARVAIAIVLAFLFGYSLTYVGVRKQTGATGEAVKITVATDTVSITSMEIVDNIIEFLIPNALIVSASSARFWWGLVASLLIAFFATVPVNRYMMSKGPQVHSH